MKVLVFLFCGLIVGMSVVGLFSPQRLISFVQRFRSQQGLYLAAAIRIVFGGALFLVAPDAYWPGLASGLGVFLIAAGLITPFIGLDRFARIVDWWAQRGDGFVRGWCVFAFLFGTLVLYAV